MCHPHPILPSDRKENLSQYTMTQGGIRKVEREGIKNRSQSQQDGSVGKGGNLNSTPGTRQRDNQLHMHAMALRHHPPKPQINII